MCLNVYAHTLTHTHKHTHTEFWLLSHSTLANDADKPFVLNTTVNLVTSTRSPDARVLPTLSVSARGNFTAKFTAPAYSPQEVAAASVAASDRVLMFSWCPAQSPDHEDDFYWTRPAATEATIDAASGLVVLNFVDTAKQSVWHHLCVQAEVDGVISQVDFMVYVLAAGAAVPLCTTSVGSIGLPTYGYVGYRLSFEVHGSPAHGEGNVSIAVGYRSRMRDVVRGSLAVGNETSMAMTLEDSATAGGHAVARIEYLVPDWAGGWVAVCFVTYVTTAPTLKSAMRCVDLVLMKNEVTQLTTSTEREFMVFTDSGLPVPNTFRVREGQLLPLTVRAFKPPKDDSISLSILGDISKDNLLDHEEAAALYAAKNMTGLVPHGVTLQMVQAGHNASFRVDYRPSRAMTGTSVEVCVVARGSAGAFRTLEDTQLCVSVVVDRCLWTVQESENLVSIAQSIGVSWLQVSNDNMAELAPPHINTCMHAYIHTCMHACRSGTTTRRSWRGQTLTLLLDRPSVLVSSTRSAFLLDHSDWYMLHAHCGVCVCVLCVCVCVCIISHIDICRPGHPR